ncbi:MAG: hypothetical protein ACI9EK_002075 [Psychroserpens sp.]|jgi:hypothetical protein
MLPPCTEEDEKYYSDEQTKLREDAIELREDAIELRMQDQEHYQGLNYRNALDFKKVKMDEARELAKSQAKKEIYKDKLTFAEGENLLIIYERQAINEIHKIFPKVEFENAECYFSHSNIEFLVKKILDENSVLVAYSLLEQDSDFIKCVKLSSEKTCTEFINIAKLRAHSEKTIDVINGFVNPAGKLKKFKSSKYSEESDNNLIIMSKGHHDKKELALKDEHSQNILEDKKLHSNKRARMKKDNKRLRHSSMSLLLDYKLLRDTEAEIKFYSSGNFSTCLIRLENIVKLANQLNNNALKIKELRNDLKTALKNSANALDSTDNWNPKIWRDIALKRKLIDGVPIPRIKEEIDRVCDTYKVHEVDRPSKRAIEQYCARNKLKYVDAS